jgi:hypothetical protein
MVPSILGSIPAMGGIYQIRRGTVKAFFRVLRAGKFRY